MNRQTASFIAALMVLLPGCGEEHFEGLSEYRNTQLCTVVSVDPLMLSTQRTAGSEIVMLMPNQKISDVEPGLRILVSYKAEMADTLLRPIPVDIAGVSSVVQGDVRIMSPEEISRFEVPVNVVSRWHTDGYLNFQATVNYSGKPVKLALAADATTLTSSSVRFVFISEDPEAVTATPGVERRFVASFDITALDLLSDAF